jgi:hypothetical protein
MSSLNTRRLTKPKPPSRAPTTRSCSNRKSSSILHSCDRRLRARDVRAITTGDRVGVVLAEQGAGVLVGRARRTWKTEQMVATCRFGPCLGIREYMGCVRTQLGGRLGYANPKTSVRRTQLSGLPSCEASRDFDLCLVSNIGPVDWNVSNTFVAFSHIVTTCPAHRVDQF